METKKSAKANLEKKKLYFLELGLILALGICLAAFEWSSPENNENQILSNSGIVVLDSDLVPPPQVIPPKEKNPNVIPQVFILTTEPFVDSTIIWIEPENGMNPPIPPKVDTQQFEVPEENEEVIPISKVPHKPVFPGGDAALLKFIADNTQYPEIAKANGVSGKVYVSFVIGTTGKVQDVTLINDVNPDLNAEALRVISLLPDWTPGRKGNTVVAVSYIIPINFVLR